MTAPASGMHSLATIIKRLEAATSRLEDIASSSTPSASLNRTTASVQEDLASHLPPPPGPTGSLAPGLAGPAATGVSTSGSGTAAQGSAGVQEEKQSPSVKAYQDEVIDGVVAEYVAASGQAGELVEKHAQLISALCTAQLAFLHLASQCTKPASPALFLPLLGPTQAALQAVIEFKDSQSRTKEGRKWGNHLSAVAEGAGGWGWVAIEKTPAPFVGEMKDSAQFYTNRVLKEFKDSDPKQAAWSRSYLAVLDGLQKYVKQWHTTGVVWNPKGVEPTTYNPSSSASAPATSPSSEKTLVPSAANTPNPGPSGGGFLSELNKGTGVTSGLKKVDASQQTHKNPALRGSSVVAEKAAPPAPAKPAGLTKPVAAKKPAVTELDGTKWVVDYHEGNNQIVIDQTEINQTVQIFGCKNSVVSIKGKVNAINMVSCQKTSILLESVVSSLSITSSPSFTVQILGSVPTILIDTTDSGQIYLSKDCLDRVEIITSKTSAINISVPSGDDGDFEERPVPEQMKSVVKGGKLVTTIVEHAG